MPTTQEFHGIAVASITVDPNRQRQDLGDLKGLAASIRRNGLLHPIIVKRDHTLVVGERRLRAVQLLGSATITAQYIDELSPLELLEVELEENLKRKNLTWQEDCFAHLKYQRGQEGFNAGAWTMEQTAERLAVSLRTVQRKIAIALEIEGGNTALTDCDTLGAAYTLFTRERDRARRGETAILDDIFAGGLEDLGTPPPPGATGGENGAVEVGPPPWERHPTREVELDILQTDFIQWAETFSGEPFNFLHVDFPYGIGQDVSDQGGGDKWQMYQDTPKVFRDLFVCLWDNWKKLVAPSAHIMFWLSFNQYEDMIADFTARGCKLNRRPLIWAKSDNVGILPDTLRGPRQTYELALMGSTGDRKIVTPVADVCWAPGSRNEAKHPSEKTWAVLRHFFRMFVDHTTRMLDPTCGCGNSLAVGWQAGCRDVTGLDIDEAHVTTARRQLRQIRMVTAGEDAVDPAPALSIKDITVDLDL